MPDALNGRWNMIYVLQSNPVLQQVQQVQCPNVVLPWSPVLVHCMSSQRSENVDGRSGLHLSLAHILGVGTRYLMCALIACKRNLLAVGYCVRLKVGERWWGRPP